MYVKKSEKRKKRKVNLNLFNFLVGYVNVKNGQSKIEIDVGFNDISAYPSST